MHCAIADITQLSDGTMSFSFGSVGSNPVSNDSVLFMETFDQCKGTGGNDGKFSGSIANGGFLPDNAGWKTAILVGSYMYGADKCAKFGTGSTANSGAVYTPMFTLSGDTVTLTFRAAGWDASKDGTSLNVSVEGGNAEERAMVFL